MSANNPNTNRIAILDGFRAIAILGVLAYHFIAKIEIPSNAAVSSIYTFLQKCFKHGNLGVEFFFIISGFVIYFTLQKTPNLSKFWTNRMIRLLPTIIIATLATYIVAILCDYLFIVRNSREIKNLIPSIIFISPKIINNLFNNVNVAYINGSYWSLWPEVQFYFLVSVIYFTNKKKFMHNFIVISSILIAINYLILHILGSNKLQINLPSIILLNYTKWIKEGFNVIDYLPFFSIGVLFYSLYNNNILKVKTFWLEKIYLCIIIFFIIYIGSQIEIRLIYSFFILLFLSLIYWSKYILFFENKDIVKIGKSSYFLYLIHDPIGLIIIFNLSTYFLPFYIILPVLLIIFFITLSNIYTLNIEVKIIKWLKK